jgi:DNA-binding transcriptional LysR family regulator
MGVVELLRDMALFVEVARTKSIKRAAEALGMPDSTLSRRISELERSLNVRLLHRTTRRIDLTEAGQLYYSHCRQIVEAARAAHQEIHSMAEKPQGRLRLALPTDFCTLFLAPLLADFAQMYPEIQFDLQLSERWVDLSAEGVDLSIRFGLQPDSTMTTRHIADVRHELYASPAYLRAKGKPTHPGQLNAHACVALVHWQWDHTWTLFRKAETIQLSIQGRIAADNIGVVRKLATLGLGIAPLDALLAKEDVDKGRLVRVLPDWSFRPLPIFALTPSKLLPAKTRAFLEFLVGRMKGYLDLQPRAVTLALK